MVLRSEGQALVWEVKGSPCRSDCFDRFLAGRAALCLSVIAVVLEPVAFDSRPGRIAASNNDQEIVVTYDDKSPPPVSTSALGEGDPQVPRGAQGRAPPATRGVLRTDFKWFSVTGSPVESHKRHFVAYKARRAIRYITRRGGFNLRLKELVVDAAPSVSQSDISYDGTWRATRDGARRRWHFVGKGALNCGDRTVKVWNMGLEDEGARLCPAPSQSVKPGTVIACVQN